MAICNIDIRKITRNPNLKARVYKPEETESSEPYGLVIHWKFFAECPIWKVDTSMSSYGGEAGIDADTTTTIYIGGNGRDPSEQDKEPLPSRVGLRFDDKDGDDGITPSASVENFYDFDGTYVYSLVVI